MEISTDHVKVAVAVAVATRSTTHIINWPHCSMLVGGVRSSGNL